MENTVTNHDTKKRKLLQQRVKGEHVHTYETLRVSFKFKGSFVHDIEDLKITSHVSKVVQNDEAGHGIPFIESNGSLTRGMEREKTQKYLQKYTLLLFIELVGVVGVAVGVATKRFGAKLSLIVGGACCSKSKGVARRASCRDYEQP